jgi:hypothetical protein
MSRPTPPSAARPQHLAAALLLLMLTLLAQTPPALGATIYLCKGYDGAIFWSSARCSEHRALIDRIHTVPDDLPFEQQVAIANGARQAATQLTAPAPAAYSARAVPQNTNGPDKATECKALDAQITQLDAMARRPQTGQMQDWITAEKRKARDRQFRLRC